MSAYSKLANILKDLWFEEQGEKLISKLIAEGVLPREFTSASAPPTEDGCYLVYIKSEPFGYQDVVAYTTEGVIGVPANAWYRYDNDVGFYEIKNVTHWMYLPADPTRAQ